MGKSFVKSAGILAFSVIIAKVLGAVYRVPLANIVGANGMGLYQFVYPVFALLLTLSSGAVPTAVSITVSEYVARGDENGARRAFCASLKICLIIGLLGTAALVAAAYPISLLQSKDAFYGYLCIAPAVLIVTAISAFRGWFNGHGNLVPGSISQITEGIVKLGVGLALASYLMKYGVKFAVAGALLGVAASELVTLVVMFISYFACRGKFVAVKLKEEKDTVSRLKDLAAPLILCGMILPTSQFLDSVLIVNLLKLNGSADPTALYGLWSGIVTPLVNLPVMVCLSLGVAVTPQMVEGREKRDAEYVIAKANTVIKLTFLMCVPFVFIYLFMGRGIISVLYPTLSPERLNLAALLLGISSVSVLSLSVFQIYSAMLQGLKRAFVPVKIIGICMAVKLVLSVILTPILGIVGSAIAAAVGYIGGGVWITIYFGLFTSFDSDFVKNAGLITLCGVIMSMLVLMSGKLQVSVVAVVCICILSAAVYFIAVMALRVFSREELKSLPMSKLLLYIDLKLNGGNK